MISFQTGRDFGVSIAGFAGAVTVSHPGTAESVTFLKMALWTTMIDGQSVIITGQELLAVLSAIVGVLGLIAGALRLGK